MISKSKSNVFYVGLGVVFLFVAMYVAGEEGVMATDNKIKMESLYKLDSDLNNEDMKKFLEAMAVDDLIIQAVLTTKTLIVYFRKMNETHYSIIKLTKYITIELTFESGVKFGAELPDGRAGMNIITVDEENHTVTRLIKVDGLEATCISQFGEEGVNTTVTAKDTKASLSFKRCEDQPPDNENIIKILKDKYFVEEGNALVN